METNEMKCRINEYKENPIMFIEEICGIKLNNYQKILFEKMYEKLHNDNNIDKRKKVISDIKGLSSSTMFIDEFEIDEFEGGKLINYEIS